MTSRVSENQNQRRLVQSILDNKRRVEKYGEEVATGVRVQEPGDSNYAGSISQYQQTLARIEQYKASTSSAKSYLQFQDDVMSSTADVMIRLKEVATQAANETNGAVPRSQMANEVWQIRDQLVSLANSTYQGRFIYGGADDDDPPFDAATYTTPASGSASQRYLFDAELGTSTLRTVEVADGVRVTLNASGRDLFATAIESAERLGRALQGYSTTPAVGTPDGGGVAYTFPNDAALQTDAIQGAIDLMNTARNTQIIPERNRLGGEMKRIETGESLLELTKQTTEEVLSRFQGADEADSATKLSLAQSALEASYTVTSRALKLSILDYL